MTDIDTLAARCLELPADYGTDNPDEGISWGRIGVGYNRDSGPREITVAECIFERLHSQFPDDVKWQSANHWGHGWCREIMIRVKDAHSEITDAFIAAAEYGEGFDSSEFESEISAAEYADTIENIGNEFSTRLRIPASMTEEEVHKAVFTWLFDAGIQAGGDDGTWFSKEEIEKAGLHLGFWDVEWSGEDEFFEELEANELGEEFRRWCNAVWRLNHERTQRTLF